ncbi:acyl-CoA dehydrogenase family protein [Candidatus Binatia bacterium]|jgi:alkylation response protein AidB-like acyl-CoA dehydrogenase|nr:acyl-CoA dehydrogenase family protein [Candidatus Binatia bacterium]
MDLSDAPHEHAFRVQVRDWIAAHAPRPAERRDPARLRRWAQDLREAGFVGASWPKEYGGGSLTSEQQAILNEELARADAPPIPGGMGLLWVGPAIIRYGTPEQKARYVPAILRGEHTWCTGYSEPNAGSDLASLRTSAVRDGDVYVVNGQKIWTTVAHLSNYCFLLARTSDGPAKQAGLTVLLVDMTLPGIEVRPLRQITGDCEFNEVFFSDVRVPVDARLGDEGQGWTIVRSALVDERTGMAASIRVDKDLDGLIALARRNGKSADPVTRQKIAELAIGCHVLRWSSARMLSDLLHGRLNPGIASSNKYFTSNLLQALSEAVLDVMGMDALLYEQPDASPDFGSASPGYRFLYNRCLTIAGGTSEVQRNIMAQRVLGLPR